MSAGSRNLSHVISRLRGALVANQDQSFNLLSNIAPSSFDSTFFSPQASEKVEKKSIDRAIKNLERVQKLCLNPKMAVKKSPPCISEIVPEIVCVLKGMNYELIGQLGHDCLVIFVRNVTAKTKQILELFKAHGLEMYDQKSQARKQLTNLTLRLSHILAELKALFSEGNYIGSNFKITKTDAALFWTNAFGNDLTERPIVSWNEFEQALLEVHSIESQLEASALRTTIDLSDDEYISIFEFDVFVRLFHPWPTIIKNWNLLAISHPGYVAFLTYDEVKERLEKSIDKPGRSLVQALLDGTKEGFYKYPDGRNITIDLSSAVPADVREMIEVSKEQYEIYCEVGMSFELCKICDENTKDMCIEPCNHLICFNCLRGWLDKGSSTCPFCRQEIKGHHSVQIGTFEQDTNESPKSGENDDGEKSSDDNELREKVDEQQKECNLNAVNETLMTTDVAVKCLCTEGFEEKIAQCACHLANNDLKFARAILSFVANYRHEESF